MAEKLKIRHWVEVKAKKEAGIRLKSHREPWRVVSSPKGRERPFILHEDANERIEVNGRRKRRLL